MGAVLGRYGTAKQWATDVREGQTIVSVFADRNATDVDLFINDRNGERIVVNHDSHPFAIVNFSARTDQDFSHLISMPRVNEKALALMTIFNAD